MLDIFILAVALCTDTFVASIAYGTNGVYVSFRKVLLLNGICSAILLSALALGTMIDGFVPERFTRSICVVCLLLLGIYKLSDYCIKRYINKNMQLHKDIRFSFSNVQFLVSIYGNPLAADKDHSNSLSTRETVFLGLAMSLDSLIAGTLAAFLKVHVWFMALAVFLMGILVMYAGLVFGKRIAIRYHGDLSWLSGVLFIFLAVSKAC